MIPARSNRVFTANPNVFAMQANLWSLDYFQTTFTAALAPQEIQYIASIVAIRSMEPPPKPSSTSLFQVYLRLRPPPSPLVQLTPQSLYPLLPPPERYLTVEHPGPESQDEMPTHITLNPPNDSRKRAVEKFAFTKVFEEQAEQIDIFKGTGVIALVEGVLGEGRDGLLATLGVTGSGKVCKARVFVPGAVRLIQSRVIPF